MTMIERVAKAIRDTNANTAGLTFTELSHAMARAAIDAMREPTIQMQIAAVHAMRVDDLDPTEKEVLLGYRAMIDQALKDEA